MELNLSLNWTKNKWANSSVDSAGTEIIDLANRLIDWFDSKSCYVVALSGGVDSAVVACAGKLSQATVHSAMGVGPATSQQDREDAALIVDLIEIEHHWVQPQEHLSPQYRTNDFQRCFHCKTHLFQTLHNHFPGWTIVTGTNLDDLLDFRPGLVAAKNASVQAPLAELGIGKEQVRQLAALWGLPVADKPASPCLASRIAYGIEVTEQRLARVEAAERYLKQQLQTPDCRVRVHQDELARIELPLDQIPELLHKVQLLRVVEYFKQLGFRHVTVDLAGLRSGSLNPAASDQAAVYSIALSNDGVCSVKA